MARPKARRPSVYVPGEITEPDNMAINKTIEVILRPELSQDANIMNSLEEFDRILPKPQHGIKLTVR